MTPASAHLRAAALTIRSGEILSLLLGGVAIGAATGHAATLPSSVFAMLTPMMVAMISLLTVNPTVLRLRGNDQLPCPTLPVSARSRGLLDLFAVVAGVWAIAGPVTCLLLLVRGSEGGASSASSILVHIAATVTMAAIAVAAGSGSFMAVFIAAVVGGLHGLIVLDRFDPRFGGVTLTLLAGALGFLVWRTRLPHGNGRTARSVPRGVLGAKVVAPPAPWSPSWSYVVRQSIRSFLDLHHAIHAAVAVAIVLVLVLPLERQEGLVTPLFLGLTIFLGQRLVGLRLPKTPSGKLRSAGILLHGGMTLPWTASQQLTLVCRHALLGIALTLPLLAWSAAVAASIESTRLNTAVLMSNFWPPLAVLLLPSALRLGLGRCREAPLAWMARPAFYVGPLVVAGILPLHRQTGDTAVLGYQLPLDPWSGLGDLSFALLWGSTTMVLLSSAFQIRAFARVNPAEAHQHALTTEQGPW